MSMRDFFTGSGNDCAAPNAVGRLASQVTQQAPGTFQDAHTFRGRTQHHEEYVGISADPRHQHHAMAPALFEDSQHYPVDGPHVFVDEFLAQAPRHHMHMAPPQAQWHAEFLRNREVENLTREFEEQKFFREKHHREQMEQWASEFQAPAEQQWAEEFSVHSSVDQFSQPQRAVGGGGIDQEAIQRLLNSDNPKFRNSKFVKFLSQLNAGEIELDTENNTVREVDPMVREFRQEQQHPSANQEWVEEFDTSYGNVSNQRELVNEWAQEFGQETAAWVDQFADEQLNDPSSWADEFNNMDWKEYVENLQNTKFGEVKSSGLRQYQFSENNPYMEAEDPFGLGLQLMRDGNLSEAVLAFEAAAQKSPENADAWRYLGQCNQENEDENQAIAALNSAIELDAYNLDALLMIGVSYTNDLEQTAALSHLKCWIENHPDYQVISFQNNAFGQYPTLDQVLNLFQEAARQNPSDVEIQTALGVLFNIANDYDAAITCFRRCVELRPDDASLWNKLGATQANGARSEEAVEAYRRALELKPNYVRALANLGISFANQGLHEQAARAYLATLSRNPHADHVWNYLRISCSSMNRPELVELTNFRDVNLFRDSFEF